MTAEFGLRFESKEDLEKLTTDSRVKELSKRLMDYKKSEKTARSDALLTLGVYGRRRERREHSNASGYGYSTWWLTAESRILTYTKQLVERQGSQFIMRPDFIVRFLAIAPSAADIRHSFESIFPSLLGIRLARRVDPTELAKILEKVAEAETMEPGRRTARISTLADKLKTQFYASRSSTSA